MATNQQSQQRRKEIEEIASTILAYLDMGNDGAVQQILSGADPHALGLIINTWYQMCVAHRGIKVTVNASAKTMEFFNAQAKEEGREEPDAEADKLAASLLHHLVDNAMNNYAKAWQRTIDRGLVIDVAARMLGFTRGMLADIPPTEGE